MTIASTLSYVPVRNPNIPIKIITIFFIINKRFGRLLLDISTIDSINGGYIKANADEQNAPISEISNTKFGISSATKTAINKIKIIALQTTKLRVITCC